MTTQTDETVYWAPLICDGWSIIVAATERGLCFVGSNGAAIGELADWLAARRPGSGLVRDERFMLPYVEGLGAYLRGEDNGASVAAMPCDLRGTPFQLAVWKALVDIPYGSTRSYSDIAAAIGRPSAVRAVGAAIGANPAMIAVPCHRVIGKNGSLTGFRGGIAMKQALLGLELGGACGLPADRQRRTSGTPRPEARAEMQTGAQTEARAGAQAEMRAGAPTVTQTEARAETPPPWNGPGDSPEGAPPSRTADSRVV